MQTNRHLLTNSLKIVSSKSVCLMKKKPNKNLYLFFFGFQPYDMNEMKVNASQVKVKV